MKKQITLYQIAKKLGVSHQVVYGWNSGKYMPSPKNLHKLAKLKEPIAEKLLKAILK